MIDPQVLEALLAGLFGLIIGSFLNVCVYRMPRDLSVARPARSFCPNCEQTIAWYDNLPLFSYAYLRGRCRNCKASIAARYPMVELATGLLFFGFVLWLGPTAEALKFCIYGAIQIGLIAMDFEERILADEFTLGGILVGLAFAVFVPMPPGFMHLFLPETWPRRADTVAESAFSAGLLSAVLWTVSSVIPEDSRQGRIGLRRRENGRHDRGFPGAGASPAYGCCRFGPRKCLWPDLHCAQQERCRNL